MLRLRLRSLLAMIAPGFLLLSAGCGAPLADSTTKFTAPTDYCALPSKTFGSATTVTVSGTALYETRVKGNLFVTDGSYYFSKPSGGSSSITINGSANTGSTLDLLATNINNNSTVAKAEVATIDGQSMIHISPRNYGSVLTFTSLSNLSGTSSTYGGITMGGEPLPVRRAEVRVKNATTSAIVQCAETADDGSFTFQIPQSSGSYVVEVASRADNTKNRAYVMNNPYDNVYYALRKTVSATANSSGHLLVAKATGTMEGGAFNILDQILEAQNYLREKTANCNTPATTHYYANCTPFTTTPDIVYTLWTPGLSPGTYVGVSGGLSFFQSENSRGRPELYIGGGLNGDKTTSDMDHFDNSVVIHEYGHFIEYEFGVPDSPGGSHNGASIIDARLAWGEGWADFFQAAALYSRTGDEPFYRDTFGTIESGTNGVYFNRSLTPLGSGYADEPTVMGEGIFREFSVARMLYKVVAPSSGFKFAEIWAVFTGTSITTMKTSTDKFKSMGRFHILQNDNLNGTSWSSISSAEKQSYNSLTYGTELDTNQSTCTTSNNDQLFPAGAIVYNACSDEDAAYADTNQFNHNKFYRYDHPGGLLKVKVTWSTARADLNIIVYRAGYYFGDLSTSVGSTQQTNPGTTGTETLTLSSLPAGQYMININAGMSAYTSPGSCTNQSYATKFKLEINDNRACGK